jgi:hypothetical protein
MRLAELVATSERDEAAVEADTLAAVAGVHRRRLQAGRS